MPQCPRRIISVPCVLLFCAFLGVTSINFHLFLLTGSLNHFKAKNHREEYHDFEVESFDGTNTPADYNHEWIMTLRKRYAGSGNGRNKTMNTTTGSGNHKHEEGLPVLPRCPSVPPNLGDKIKVNLTVPRLYGLHKRLHTVRRGGKWKPVGCNARHRVAIIIPYRSRAAHLRILLAHLHPLLQKQQLDYRIFVVEPAGDQTFNKGSIMNAGFAEAMKFDDFQCVVFHDVDMIPENEKNIYSCPENAKVRHLAMSINKYGYRDTSKAWSGRLFGGVVIFTPKSLLTVNGYSNRYEGWGGEDDDMFYRVNRSVGFTRGPVEIMRYHMVKHDADVGNPPNPKRWSLLTRVNSSHTFWETDGLTTINYAVLERERRQLYTWVYLELLKPRS